MKTLILIAALSLASCQHAFAAETNTGSKPTVEKPKPNPKGRRVAVPRPGPKTIESSFIVTTDVDGK